MNAPHQFPGALAQIERRRAALRLTEPEMLEAAGVPRVRWWRAKSGKTKSLDNRLRVIRLVEAALDRLEAPCSLCGERVTKPCDQFGCPITKDEA